MVSPEKLEQGGSDWMAYRLGKCTGSRVKDALAVLKNGSPGQKRRDYLVELLAERMTGLVAEHYVTREMEFGTDNEALARGVYEKRLGVDVFTVGIFQHPRISQFCASPDGTIGKDGLLEIKCPKTATHIGWMMDGVLPEEHALQCYAELACSGREWVDFVSFDPRLPARHQLFVKRLYRDEEFIRMMEDGVIKFLTDLDALMSSLNQRNPEVKEDAPDHADEFLTDEDLDAFFGKEQA